LFIFLTTDRHKSARGGSKQKLVFLSRLNIGPFNGGLNVAKKAEIARFALKMDVAFADSDEHMRTSLEFDRCPYQNCPALDRVADAIIDARLITYQEEVAFASAMLEIGRYCLLNFVIRCFRIDCFVRINRR
jgi:hypothetical protein